MEIRQEGKEVNDNMVKQKLEKLKIRVVDN